jgi:hypothetical protein
MNFNKGDLVIRVKQDFLDTDGNVIRGIVDPSDSIIPDIRYGMIMPTYWIRVRCEDGALRWYDVDQLAPDLERIRERQLNQIGIL